MNKRLVLHIGTDKTGTTALQQFFDLNSDVLQQEGIWYPMTGRAKNTHHHLLISPISSLARQVGFEIEKPWLEVVEELLTEISARQEPNILISSEALFQDVDVGNLHPLRDHFDEITIVVYIRRQDEYAMSSYEESVKSLGESEEICADKFVNTTTPEVLRKWAALAKPANNLVVRPYEQVQFHGDTLYSDFMWHVFQIAIDERFAMPEPSETNPRLTPDALQFLRLLNTHVPHEDAKQFVSLLLDYSKELDANVETPFIGRDILSDQEKLQILKQCESDNQELARSFLGREDGRLFFDAVPETEGPPATIKELSATEALAIAQRLFELAQSRPTSDPETLRRLSFALFSVLHATDPNS